MRKSVTHFSVVIQSEDNYGVSKPDEDQETPLGSFFFFYSGSLSSRNHEIVIARDLNEPVVT